MPDPDIHVIATDRAPAPAGHYSQAVAAGGQLYISGQLPLLPDGSPLRDSSFAGQAAQALDNMLNILAAAGVRPERLARVTAYIVGSENWASFNEVYARKLPHARPARTVVPVAELHHGFLVEVDAIAFECVMASGDNPPARSHTRPAPSSDADLTSNSGPSSKSRRSVVRINWDDFSLAL